MHVHMKLLERQQQTVDAYSLLHYYELIFIHMNKYTIEVTP